MLSPESSSPDARTLTALSERYFLGAKPALSQIVCPLLLATMLLQDSGPIWSSGL